MITQDQLWKGTVKILIEDLILLQFGAHAHRFDLARGVEILEQEMAQIDPESLTRRRVVDVLVKVWLKDGTDAWFLIHLEIQGYEDETFTLRMFVYFYRILDKYGKQITQLAILTDEDDEYHPTEHVQEFLGTKTVHKFNTIKLSKKKAEDFSDRSNIFTLVLETAWLGMKKNRKTDEEKFNYAMQLKRRLLDGNFPKEKIRAVLRFLERTVTFGKQEFTEKLKMEIQEFKAELTLDELEVLEAEEIGFEKGMEEGMEKGELLKSIAAIRKMTQKNFAPEVIADLLEVAEAFVLDIQRQLKKEPEILAQLAEGEATVDSVAKKLEVSNLLVQVLKDASA